MSDVNKEIEAMAEAMEKSTETPKDALFKTLRELGADGIKEKLIAKSEDGSPLLSDAERDVLVDALTEMKKAKSPSMDSDYQATYVSGNVYKDTVIQEDKADDDADEKLVKPANAKMKHQGDNQPEGFEGQVIKSDEAGEKKEMKKIAEKEAKDEVKDHNKKMHKASAIKIDKDSEKTADEAVGKVKKNMKKCDDEKMKVMGKDYGMEKGGPGSGKKKGAEPDANMQAANAMVAAAKKQGLMKMKKSIEDEFEAAGTESTPELVKAEMKKRLLKEEDQLGNDETEKAPKARGDKARPEALKVEKENDAAQKKVNDLGQGKMKKAMGWAGSQALLAANTGGRNHNFSVNSFYDEALQKAEEANKPAEETLAKAEGETKDETAPMDINDIIEKSMDQTRDENIADQLMIVRDAHVNPKFIKSFGDNEIANALGLTEEEAKKILGE